MQFHAKPTSIVLFLLPAMFMSISCSALRGVGEAITNLSRCSFKVESVSNFSLAGISLGNKSSYSIADGLTLAASFARNEFPASFTLNVAAVNPNDGTGGTPSSAATLTRFAWTLLIDNTETIRGDIAEPFTIPGTGQQSIIPLTMSLDLFQFFRNRGYESIINLALALGGVNRTTSSITLRARPTIDTRFGPINYPEEITIVDREFRSR